MSPSCRIMYHRQGRLDFSCDCTQYALRDSFYHAARFSFVCGKNVLAYTTVIWYSTDMKIAIGSSMKYRSLVGEVVAKLSELGVEPLFPNLDYSHEDADKADSPEEKKRLALEHYAAIYEADIVYLLTPAGYMGTSCKLELGYAIACNKPIYFSEPTNDVALDCYAQEFIHTSLLNKFTKLVPPGSNI